MPVVGRRNHDRIDVLVTHADRGQRVEQGELLATLHNPAMAPAFAAAEARVREFVGEIAVVGQQQQAFRVIVEAADRIEVATDPGAGEQIDSALQCLLVAEASLLDHLAVPQRAVLEVALLGLVVDVDDSEALVVAVGPFEFVDQGPQQVAAHVDAVLDHRQAGDRVEAADEVKLIRDKADAMRAAARIAVTSWFRDRLVSV